MKNYARLLAFLLCAVSTSSAFAQLDSDFAKANQDYAQGNFNEAISGYRTLVGSGQWSANLFYDLGNAYFRTGDFGRAILNYERALALERHHPEATANLQIARDEALSAICEHQSIQHRGSSCFLGWSFLYCQTDLRSLAIGRHDRLVDSFAPHLRHRDFGDLWT